MTPATNTHTAADHAVAHVGTMSHESLELHPTFDTNEIQCDPEIIQLCANPTRSSVINIHGHGYVLALYNDNTTVDVFKTVLYDRHVGIKPVPKEQFAFYGKDAAGYPTVLNLDDTLHERFSSRERPLAGLNVGYAPDCEEDGDFFGCSHGYLLVGGDWKMRRFSMPNEKKPSLDVYRPIVGGSLVKSLNVADYDMYLPGQGQGFPKTPYARSCPLVLKHKQPKLLENADDKELVFCFRSFLRRDMVFWRTYPVQLQLKAKAQQQAKETAIFRRIIAENSAYSIAPILEEEFGLSPTHYTHSDRHRA